MLAHRSILLFHKLSPKPIHFFYGLLNLNNSSSEIRSCYVGNSSAGVKETPALKCPSIIIGDRQKGRLHSTNVVFVDNNEEHISKEISLVFDSDEFINTCKEAINPYGDGTMGKKSLELFFASLDWEILQNP